MVPTKLRAACLEVREESVAAVTNRSTRATVKVRHETWPLAKRLSSPWRMWPHRMLAFVALGLPGLFWN